MSNARYGEAIIKVKLDTVQARQQLEQQRQEQASAGSPATTASAGRRGSASVIEAHQATHDAATGASPLQTLLRAGVQFAGLQGAGNLYARGQAALQGWQALQQGGAAAAATKAAITAMVAKAVFDVMRDLPKAGAFLTGLGGGDPTKQGDVGKFFNGVGEWLNKVSTMWDSFKKSQDEAIGLMGYNRRLGGTLNANPVHYGSVAGFLYDKAQAESQLEYKVEQEQARARAGELGSLLRNMVRHMAGR